MAEAAESPTPPRRYDEEARAALKAHIIKRKAFQRDVDWDGLWAALEEAAQAYVQGARIPQQPAPREIRKMILKRVERIDAVREDLAKPINWYVEADKLLRGGLPGDCRHLDEALAERRDALMADAQELEGFPAVSNNIHRILFQSRVLLAGCRLLPEDKDTSGGHEGGPLVQFMARALKPILGEATPHPVTLRSFIRRRLKGG